MKCLSGGHHSAELALLCVDFFLEDLVVEGEVEDAEVGAVVAVAGDGPCDGSKKARTRLHKPRWGFFFQIGVYFEAVEGAFRPLELPLIAGPRVPKRAFVWLEQGALNSRKNRIFPETQF